MKYKIVFLIAVMFFIITLSGCIGNSAPKNIDSNIDQQNNIQQILNENKQLLARLDSLEKTI